MLINTEQDLYAACDQYQGHTITLTKPGHTAWQSLQLKAVGIDSQPGSHIPVLCQIHTDRGIYSLTPPFEITEEEQPVKSHYLTDEMLDQLILALSELQVRRYKEAVR